MTTTATTVLSDKRRRQLQYDSLDGSHVNVNLHLNILGGQFPACPPSLEGRPRAVQLLKQIYLPRSLADDSVNYIPTCCSWLEEAAGLTGTSQALDVALHSLYVSQLYATGNNMTPLETCLDVYNTALQKLRVDLEDSKAKLRDETLAAIVVISTNELFLNPVDNAWEAHASGISEILKLRSALKTGDSVRPYICSRLHTICTLNAIITRRSLVVTNLDWRRLKYANHCGKASEFDKLIDILGELPVLLEETEALLKKSKMSISLVWATRLIQSYAIIAQRLYSWQEELRGTTDTPLYWAAPSFLSHAPEASDAKNLFPLILNFTSSNVAISLILSWAVLVQLYCSLSLIYELMERTFSGDESSLPEFSVKDARNSLDHEMNENGMFSLKLTSPCSFEWLSKAFCITEGDKLVRLLCQSMEYCHKIDIGTIGPQAVAYPQWIMRRYFRFRPGYERELKWCYDFKAMTGAGFRCGINIMDFGDHTE